MAKYAGYKKRSVKRTYRRKSVSKRVRKPSRTLSKIVQKIIHKDVEDKIAFRTTGNSLINFNSEITSANDMQVLLPQVANGDFAYQRVGDELRGKLLNIKGYLNMQIDNSTNDYRKRIAVRMMVVQSRRFPNVDDAYNNWSSWGAKILQKGTTVTGFNGYIQDLFVPLNTNEVIKYYDRVFYLSQDSQYLYTGGTGSGVAMPNLQGTKDIRNTIKLFNIKIPLRNRKIRYESETSSNVNPVNFGPVLLLGYAHLDGSSPDQIDARVGLCYDTYFTYEDA